MEWRQKVYYRGGNSQQIQDIRESLRQIRAKKRLKQSSMKEKKQRTRSLMDVKSHIQNNQDEALNGGYEERCTFLNKLCSLIAETTLEELGDNEFFEDLCQLMLKFVNDDHPCIRAMCFHLLRKTTQNGRNLTYLLTSHVDIYVVRAIDLQIENEQERIEAFKLISWMMKVYEKSSLKKLIDDAKANSSEKKYAFPKSIMQPIISIALGELQKEKPSDSYKSAAKKELPRDKMGLPCVGLFLEFCLSEPDLILDMAGTDWIVRVLTGVSTMPRRIVILVSHILMTWLDSPHIRLRAGLHMVLEQIFAPLIEYGFFQRKPTIANYMRDPFGMNDILEHFKVTFLCLLRSWPGLFSCAAVGANGNISASSPLRLLEYLGLGTVENENLIRIRNMVVDICCEFVDVPYASSKFESWTEALQFYKTMHLPNKYKSSLKNDFVVAQNDTRMFHDVNRQSRSLDLLASFRTLSQFILINASLPQCLARLILTNPDSQSGLKATLLLADLLRHAPSHVPSNWRAPVLSLPTLVQSACEKLVLSRAAAAVNGTLDQLHEERTFVHSENAELVLHRVDELNRSWIRSAANSATMLKESYLYIFVPNVEPQIVVTDQSSPEINEESRRGNFYDTALSGRYDKNKLMLLDHTDNYDYSRHHSRSLNLDDDDDRASTLFHDENGLVNWSYAEYYFENLENDSDDHIIKEFAMKSMEEYVIKIFEYLTPLTQQFERRIISHQQIIVVKLILKLVLRVLPFNESIRQDYHHIINKYLTGFQSAFQGRETNTSYFYPRNLSYTGSMYHFAIVGFLSTTPYGTGMLNELGILHM
ncbi:unnamed protein product [Caenorhabditis bovis]|uniref:Rapamycin-insensitive companion of mTOR N-terminal domain-containing protein n=1 Tax=Caenorhabditis bovis TaxID=2654633 RepID=A0A8S1EZ86_9PELO|nr:unnamed protein product [Caenorhabditis bovis]